MTLISKANEELEEMEKARLNIEWAKLALAHLDKLANNWAFYEDYVAVYIAPQQFAEFRRLMGYSWKRIHSHTSDNGYTMIRYQKGDHILTVILDASLVKNQCRLEKVGTKEVSVYRVVCND